MPRRADRIDRSLPEDLERAWHRALDVAGRIRELEPWEHVAPDAVLGIRDPRSGEIDWCVVLGAAGEFYGVAMYPGDAGFASLRRLLTGEIDELDGAIAHRGTTLVFQSAASCVPECKRMLKQLGRTYRGAHAWPELLVHVPGLAPLPPADVAGLDRVANALAGIAALVPWAQHEPHGGSCGGFDRAWVLEPPFATAEPRRLALPDVRQAPPPALPFDQIAVARLAERPSCGTTWYLDWFCGQPLDDESGPPFIAIHPFVAEIETGMLLATGVVHLQDVAGHLQGEVLRAARGKGLPSRLVVRREELATALLPFATAARVPLDRDPGLVTVTRDVHQSFVEFLGG